MLNLFPGSCLKQHKIVLMGDKKSNTNAKNINLKLNSAALITGDINNQKEV